MRVTVGISGTGGGFEKFCAGETDANDASRQIEADEEELCTTAGVEWVEMQVANDGLAVVVNPENDWADSLTVEQLKMIWNEGSTIDNWNQVDPSFPDVPLELFGAGTDWGRSTTSPKPSTARRASAGPTTRPPRTTTSRSRAWPAPRAAWRTSASPTTSRTPTS